MPLMPKLKSLSLLTMLLYVGIVILVNILFQILPPIMIFGGFVPPATLAVGSVFVVRDYMQQNNPHWTTIVAMLVATLLTWLLASQQVALASALAFLVGEGTDFMIFQRTGRTLKERILISSAISVPLESALFLYMLGHLGLVAWGLMCCFKMLASVVVYILPQKTC